MARCLARIPETALTVEHTIEATLELGAAAYRKLSAGERKRFDRYLACEDFDEVRLPLPPK